MNIMLMKHHIKKTHTYSIHGISTYIYDTLYLRTITVKYHLLASSQNLHLRQMKGAAEVSAF